jgi:hypothetical protein
MPRNFEQRGRVQSQTVTVCTIKAPCGDVPSETAMLCMLSGRACHHQSRETCKFAAAGTAAAAGEQRLKDRATQKAEGSGRTAGSCACSRTITSKLRGIRRFGVLASFSIPPVLAPILPCSSRARDQSDVNAGWRGECKLCTQCVQLDR